MFSALMVTAGSKAMNHYSFLKPEDDSPPSSSYRTILKSLPLSAISKQTFSVVLHGVLE